MTETTLHLAKWLPSDDPRAIEINEVLARLGGMASHGGNLKRFGTQLQKGEHEALTELLDGLQRDIDNQREHPFAFDGDLLLHHALQVALLLKHVNAGSAEWLRSYGVEVD